MPAFSIYSNIAERYNDVLCVLDVGPSRAGRCHSLPQMMLTDLDRLQGLLVAIIV